MRWKFWKRPETRTEYNGNEAERFAKRLKQVRVDKLRWEVEFIDPKSGETWIMDYPSGAAQGGGPPRLRKVS